MSFITLAYIDPGSGSLIFQTVIAGGLALLIFMKSARVWLSDKIRSLLGKPTPNETPETKTGKPSDEA